MSSSLKALGNVEYPFIAIDLRSTLSWSGSTDWFQSMGQIELSDI